MTFCANTNSPIDLIRTETETCDNKCLYEFNYSKSSLNVHNFKTHLEFTFQNNEKSDIKFNGLNYTLEKMLLFRDSVHKLNGKRKSAELVIIHNQKKNPSKKLVVCILIIVVNPNESDLDYIIDKTSILTPNNGNKANIIYPSFSLNNLIPKKKYFNYKGNLFYVYNNSPLCNKMGINETHTRYKINSYLHDIIVLDNVISINTDNYNKLIKLINKHTFILNYSEKVPVFYSINNAVLGTGIMGEDDIYIECKPTGEGEKKNVQEYVDIKNEDRFKFIIKILNKTFGFLKINGPEIIGSIIGGIIIYIILKIIKSIN